MLHIKISGIPYGKNKKRGFKTGPKEWQEAIMNQTEGLEKINYPCIFKAKFILPPDKYPSNYPYGSDLDNLLKNTLDALQKTCLSNDSLILELFVSKIKGSKEESGVVIEFQKLDKNKVPIWETSRGQK